MPHTPPVKHKHSTVTFAVSNTVDEPLDVRDEVLANLPEGVTEVRVAVAWLRVLRVNADEVAQSIYDTVATETGDPSNVDVIVTPPLDA